MVSEKERMKQQPRQSVRRGKPQTKQLNRTGNRYDALRHSVPQRCSQSYHH